MFQLKADQKTIQQFMGESTNIFINVLIHGKKKNVLGCGRIFSRLFFLIMTIPNFTMTHIFSALSSYLGKAREKPQML